MTTGTIVLGGGMTSVGGRDPSNSVIKCVGEACAKMRSRLAYLVPTHSAYTFPLPGTTYMRMLYRLTAA